MTRLLIVEDDREIRGMISDYLSRHDYEVVEAGDGNQASDFIHNDNFDIILMDMMLPYKSGDLLIKELRALEGKKSLTPVIVISAKTMKDVRLEVLRMGADDYIVKPFDLDEVLVRIEVVLRRITEGKNIENDSKDIISYHGIVIDKTLNIVTYNENNMKLTAKEMQLLILFFENPKKTFSKANLYENVWEQEYSYEDNTINVHMSNLRNKLKKETGREIIETVWGIGYRLVSE
ncbi:MAG: response regulator transcription factor [Eubacterium sp.]|nr:response regulator transcription factor [Eubacterium sp.]